MSDPNLALEPAVEVLDADGVEHRLLVPILPRETYDADTLDAFRARVDQAVEDAVACFIGRRELVAYPFNEFVDDEQIIATVRSIARWGARLALGLQRNPDRVGDAAQGGTQ